MILRNVLLAAPTADDEMPPGALRRFAEQAPLPLPLELSHGGPECGRVTSLAYRGGALRGDLELDEAAAGRVSRGELRHVSIEWRARMLVAVALLSRHERPHCRRAFDALIVAGGAGLSNGG